jgi:hypothetical protein
MVVFVIKNLRSTRYVAGMGELSPKWQVYPRFSGDKVSEKFKVSSFGGIYTAYWQKKLSSSVARFSLFILPHPQLYPQIHSAGCVPFSGRKGDCLSVSQNFPHLT